MIQISNYSSLRKTPKAKENTAQKASSSQNLNSKCSASHANGAKADIIIPQKYFGYSSLLKTPKAKENTFQKASSSQNLNPKCFANHANEAKAPIVKMHNSYPMLNQGKVNFYQSGGLKLNSPALLDYSGSTRPSQTSDPSIGAKTSKTYLWTGGWDGYGGCYICAIACVAKVKYSVAHKAAIKYGGFIPYAGMNYKGAMKTLEHLGIRSTFHPFQPQSFDDFPDKAIFGVTVGGKACHVAAFSRRNGQGWVYDSLEDEPEKCESYAFGINTKDYHLEIHE